MTKTCNIEKTAIREELRTTSIWINKLREYILEGNQLGCATTIECILIELREAIIKLEQKAIALEDKND